MSAVVEATTTAPWATGSTTFTQNKPTGTVDGDFLVAIVFTGNDNGTTDLTVTGVPSGWTLIRQIGTVIAGGGSFNPVNVYSYYKIASSEGASWNWTLSTSGSTLFYGGAVFRISGTNQVDASDDGTDSNDDSPEFTGGITPIGIDGILIMATVATDAPTAGFTSGGYAVTNNNPTWTELFDDNAGEGSGNSIHGSIAYATRASATATGDWTLTYAGGSGNADTASQLISIPSISNATGTFDTPVFSPDFYAPSSVEVGTVGTFTHLEITPDVYSPDMTKVIPPSRWTDTEKGSKTWTDQTK